MQETFKKLPRRRQTEILDAAARVFAEKGYHRASTPDICARAGISNGALYKYFRNKEAIFVSVLNHTNDLIVNELSRKYTGQTESFSEAIETLFSGLTKFTRRYRPYVEIWVDLSSCSMNRFAAEISAKVEAEGRKVFRGLVEEAVERGEIDSSVNVDLATYTLDCHMTLFAYSLVSEYHRKRFSTFFNDGGRGLSQTKRIELVVESAKLLVGAG